MASDSIEMEVEVETIGVKEGVNSEEEEEEGMLDEYSNLIELIQINPFKIELHLNHILITKKLKLTTELDEARQMFIQYFPMNESMWLEWIADKKALISSSSTPDDLSLQMELIELYKRSILDYLSIPLLLSYSHFFISNYYASKGLLPLPEEVDEEDAEGDEAMDLDSNTRNTGEPNPILGALFDLDALRAVRDEVLSIGGGHLTMSSKLWDLWKRFELDIMKEIGVETSAAIVNSMYLARLAVPHMDIEDTFSSYSSFVTKYFNTLYSKMLPEANKIYSKAHELVQAREFEERKLKKAKFSEEAYLTYIQWELDVKTPAVRLLNSLFERGIKDHPLSIPIWEAYLDLSNRGTKPNPDILPLLEKVVKSIPSSASLWATYLRAAERNQLGIEAIDGIFGRAMSSGLLDSNMEELIILFEARAGYHRREVEQILMAGEDPDESLVERILEGLVEGIRKVNDTTEDGSGDPQLRLEKHLIRMYERFDRGTEASALWASLTAARPESYAVWYGRADFETRANNFSEAHKVYAEGCGSKNLDYPEYLLEAWSNFEKLNGTLIDLEFSMIRIKRQKKNLQARREREALAAAQYAPAPVVEEVIPVVEASTSAPNVKRERSPAVEAPVAKRAKIEKPPPLKRDRENSTVFIVAPAEAQLTEESIKNLFKDCGPIRECTLKVIESKSMGMVEFMDKESVGAARTKDKKKINDVEMDVHIAWESCLFVTNFPVGYDKGAVESLFSKYGTIFDTRWPSKTYKDTRRFCYVQFTSPSSAQAALELHGTTLDSEGIKLIVYISDPTRKKGRTDAGANNKELYVQGLSRFVTESDLRTLFEPYGAIKGIRVVLDEKKECKGFGFVEFEEEVSALKSLELNNYELKKRRMSVVIAQARAVGTQNPREAHKGEKKYEVDARSLKIRGIIAGTEEAIVQQDLEKHAIVKFVKMVAGETEAEVEFESAAEVGKILLLNDTITIAGAKVEISAVGAQPKKNDGTKISTKPLGGTGSGGSTFMPRQAARGGRGRGGLGGRGRGGIGSNIPSGSRPIANSTPTTSSTTSTAAASTSTAGSKSQDDFRALMNKK